MQTRRATLFALSSALLLAVLCTPSFALNATFYTEQKIIQGNLEFGSGKNWKIEAQDFSPNDLLAVDLNNINPRTTEFGVRMVDKTFVAGRFTDFTNGQDNTLETDSFGPIKIGKDLPAILYMGGYPGQFPDKEISSASGVILKNGELIAGDILYAADRFVGVKVSDRIRKYNINQLYAAILKPVNDKAVPTASWRVMTQNGDMLWCEASDLGFQVKLPGAERAIGMDRIAGAENIKRLMPLTPVKPDPTSFRIGRNGEGHYLDISAQCALPNGWWQRGPSTVTFSMPPGARGVIFRAWREPGFFRGQIKARVHAGAATLQEIEWTPGQRIWDGVAALPATQEISLTLASGNDESLGDRLIWQRVLVFK